MLQTIIMTLGYFLMVFVSAVILTIFDETTGGEDLGEGVIGFLSFIWPISWPILIFLAILSFVAMLAREVAEYIIEKFDW